MLLLSGPPRLFLIIHLADLCHSASKQAGYVAFRHSAWTPATPASLAAEGSASGPILQMKGLSYYSDSDEEEPQPAVESGSVTQDVSQDEAQAVRPSTEPGIVSQDESQAAPQAVPQSDTAVDESPGEEVVPGEVRLDASTPFSEVVDIWIAQSARTGDGPPPEYKSEIMQVYENAPPEGREQMLRDMRDMVIKQADELEMEEEEAEFAEEAAMDPQRDRAQVTRDLPAPVVPEEKLTPQGSLVCSG